MPATLPTSVSALPMASARVRVRFTFHYLLMGWDMDLQQAGRESCAAVGSAHAAGWSGHHHHLDQAFPYKDWTHVHLARWARQAVSDNCVITRTQTAHI